MVVIKVLATFFCLAASATGQADPAIADPVTTLGLSTLILSTTSYSAILPKNILEGYGAPHDVYTGLIPDMSEDKWHSIVIADGSVDPTLARDYAKRTSARIVILETFPRSTDHEAFGVRSLSVSAHNANLTVVDSPEAHKLAGVVNKIGSWNLTEAVPRAVIISDPSKATGFLRYDVPKSQMMGAYVTDTSYGTQEMHFTFQNFLVGLSEDFMPSFYMPDEFTQANLAFGHAWMEWVTRGVYLGYRRATLNIHIDDWYIQSRLYDTGETFRLDSNDVETYVAWRDRLHTNLPNGSDIKFEPAYNAAGISMFGIPASDGLVSATAKYADQFYWVSHTFTHMNMDKLDSVQCTNNETVCRPDAAIYDAELTYNQKVARGEPLYSDDMIPLYKLNPGTEPGQFLNNNTDLLKNNYSPHALVTPEISGLWPAEYTGTPPPGREPYLRNKEFFDALIRNEIYNLVGDNSRAELNVANIYHAVVSTVEQYGQDGVILVPRWSPNVAFSCNSYACLEKFYADGACAWVLYGPPCPDEPMSGPEIVIREGKITTIPLLQLRWDPYMFHQANMHEVEYDNGTAPLVGAYTEEAVRNFQRFVDGLPLISYPLDVLAGMYRRRMARDLCNVEGHIEFDAAGNPTGVTATGTGSCEVVLTLSDSSNMTFGANETTVRYGPDVNVFKNITAPAGVDATVSILTPPGTTMKKMFARRRAKEDIEIAPKVEKLENDDIGSEEVKPESEKKTEEKDTEDKKESEEEKKAEDKEKSEEKATEDKKESEEKKEAEDKEKSEEKATEDKKESEKTEEADNKVESWDNKEAEDKKKSEEDETKSDNEAETTPAKEGQSDATQPESGADETKTETSADKDSNFKNETVVAANNTTPETSEKTDSEGQSDEGTAADMSKVEVLTAPVPAQDTPADAIDAAEDIDMIPISFQLSGVWASSASN
ncbi:hypothetical protein SARC_01186 [Sphaeroforma arctica JP610]|uniref:Agd3 deacetylase domain-containing protein n=1 Tax=Sphaeroforma arctica JP610 TaxID=667725 RepID=A0A0L0GCE6_9EUKA|nr:hypothetical protein SARC_01186 [Sphaeroforma arctica JP610]KNC86680.1 hypothetical protein SARC_01186 [Sphaeroforma arctica JP610]|eukprot:XP_014160582.1 hypothetical protein SARC_01186 [Sphaeroforma arctica JP610]